MTQPPHATSRRPSAWLTAFVLCNAALATLIANTNLPAIRLAPWEASLFQVLAIPAHFLFFCFVLSVPAWLAARLSRKPTWTIATAVPLQFLGIALVAANTKVYALYRFHLDPMVVNMVLGGAFGDQVRIPADMWVQVAAGLLLLLALELGVAWGLWRALSRRAAGFPQRAIWTSAALVMCLSQAMAVHADAREDRAMLARVTHIPWVVPLTMKKQLRRLGVETTRAARPPDVDDRTLAYPRKALQCVADPKLNVIMVVVDSLRFDMVDARTMPNVWRYAQGAQWYQDHYSTGNATRFGLFGLMYGLPGRYWFAMLNDQRPPAWIEYMRRAGFAMHIHGSAPLYSPEFDRTVFSSVRDRIATGPSGMQSGERDRAIVERLQAALRVHPRGERLFGFVFLDAAHSPYSVPQGVESPFHPVAEGVNYLKLGPGRDPTPIFNRYRASVHFVDTLIGQLLRTIEDSGLADESVVVITGDHGEEFNELRQNYWGHGGNYSDYQVRTPLIVHWPGKSPRRIEQVTSHEDLVPTLTRHALGCSNDLADYSTGIDLFAPSPASRPVLVEGWSTRAIRHGERIYLFDRLGAPQVLDRRHVPIPDASADPKAIAHAWDLLTRFRAQ